MMESPCSEEAVWGRKSALSIEFDPEVTRGLCARGNYCQELAFHKDRALRSNIGTEPHAMDDVASSIFHALKAESPDRTAILLDGSLTLEESSKAIALAEKLGTKLVALLPAEDVAVAPFKNSFTFDAVSTATTNIVIGDVFTMNPTITKLLHDASALGRRNIMVNIDTVHSRTGWFAHPELVVGLGKTSVLIEAIIASIGGKVLDELPLSDLGISIGDFSRTVDAIKSAEGKGNIIFSPGWHFVDPFTIASAAQRLAELTGFGFGVLPVATNSRGIYRLLASAGCDITGTYKALASGDIDALLALDCDPIEALPNIKIPKVFALTGQLMSHGYKNASHFIPSRYLFEKTGKILGTEENIISLDEAIDGPRVKAVGDILDAIIGGKAPVLNDLESIVTDVAEVGTSPISGSGSPDGEFIAVGNGNVLHHGDGRYTRRMDFPNLRAPLDTDAVEIPTAIVEKLGLSDGDDIELSSKYGTAKLKAKKAPWLDNDKVLIPMHNTVARGLFDWGNQPALTPIGVKIKKL